MFSKRVKELRKKYNLTQAGLAKKIDVTTGAVGLWETGKRFPDFETIVKISKIFNVTIDYLMNEELENKIIIIGKNGDFKSFSLNERDLITISSLADSLQDNKLD